MAVASDTPWYEIAAEVGENPGVEDGRKLAAATTQWLKSCQDRLSSRRDADLFHNRLCYGPDPSGTGARDAVDQLMGWNVSRSRFNLVAAVVSTATSLIAHHAPMPLYLTQEGSFQAMRSARARTQAITGLFNELGIHRHTARTFVDANTYSFGVLHGYLDDEGRPAVERVNPMECLFDPIDAYDGNPRMWGRRRPYPVEVLVARYEEHEEALKTAAKTGLEFSDRRDFSLPVDAGEGGVVMLEEIWHLPAGKGWGDGRKVVQVGNVVLENTPYEWDRLPFVFYRFEERPVGILGIGITERAVDSQIRVNELIRKNSKLQDLGSNTWVFTDQASQVKAQQLTNAPLQVIRVSGREPKIVQHNATAQDCQVEIDRIQAQLLFSLGLSESAASGERAPGVYSGAGLRATDDIQVRRLVPHVKRWEAYHLDIARMLEWLCDCASELDKNYAIDAEDNKAGTRWVKRLVWKDIKMPKGTSLKLQIFPISNLPTTPAGKWSAVTEWVQNGFISKPYALKFLEFPDTDAAVRRELADLEFAEWMVEQALDEEPIDLPEYLELDVAMEVFRTSWLQLRRMNAPESVLDILSDLMHDVAEAQGALVPPPAPAGAMGPVPGGADPLVDPAMAQAQAQGLPPGAVAPPGLGI
jgi:hypothetical protein